MAKLTKSNLILHKFSEGFTLIELLVVLLIVGILSAIALPIYLEQIQKAKLVEPKVFTASCLRVQQANYEGYGTLAGEENSQLEETLFSQTNKYTVNASLYKSQNPEEFIQAVVCCVAASNQKGNPSYAQALVYTNTNEVVSTTCEKVASIKP
ncbi:hypothetical protein PL11201_420010 [Planktothrix sp. PCC 11201]|uniref:prepilin-type N-terminal cleavage/methylation domain-containing protein n=1 Tax=Planktothrix sp. PCC 11201 TaxID=1729650 RepID=UPI0009147C9C|nr:prepilin-type N-terminal cleavage/methylation domain-containing protein [Planktothrix sp. PCC 11201]SKB12670.1 hypothetical protein PL11201_420010 [Planktothrix sp. PCC 11201]